jgi:hypothetical protein
VLHPERERPVAGRPLVNASFAINYAIGGLNTRGYHAVNLAIHLAAALLVFGIVRRTVARTDLARLPDTAAHVAFATALIWVVHPLTTEAVDYVTQRTELMMALFYLLTLYAAIRSAASPASPWSAIAIAACAAGMACKESMVTAPVVVVLYDRVFLFDSLRRAVRKRWPLYAGLAAGWIVLGVLLASGPRVHSAGFASGVSAWTYLLNQAAMILRYVKLAVWPQSLVIYYGWPLPLTISDALPALLAVAALLGAAVAAMARAPKAGFAAAFFSSRSRRPPASFRSPPRSAPNGACTCR